MDEDVVLKRFYSLFLDPDVDLIIALDSHDLFASLWTQYKSIDRSVRSVVNYIRYQFEMGNTSGIC